MSSSFDYDTETGHVRRTGSNELPELRGLSARAVAARAAAVDNPKIRSLIWALQAWSLQAGGLRRVASELFKMFPTHRREIGPGRLGFGQPAIQLLSDFLAELCVNPRLWFEELDLFVAKEDHPRTPHYEFKKADCAVFSGVLEALFEYKRRDEEAARGAFFQTENGRIVWESLDHALRTGTICLVNGLQGRGKTEAAKAWCRCHLGEARFVSLKGVTNKTTAFRDIARALGLAASPGRTATEMQAGIEEVLQPSPLLLCIDEAHWLFNQSQRIYTRPELVDWIGTLSNDRVPICLVTTPQFLTCMQRAADQAQWNWKQFRRRLKYVELKESTSPGDLERVTRHVFAGSTEPTLKLIRGYVSISGRDLSAVGDVRREAGQLAELDGRKVITFEDVNRAIKDELAPSDAGFAKALDAARPRRSGRPRVPDAALLPLVINEDDSLAGRAVTPLTLPDTPLRRAGMERFEQAVGDSTKA